jgi:DNA oxidative demethylase
MLPLDLPHMVDEFLIPRGIFCLRRYIVCEKPVSKWIGGANSAMRYEAGYLDLDGQTAVLAAVREGVAKAPLFSPVMPRTGVPFSVRMTNFGSLGWVSDRAGYRYQATHPDTGLAWPDIPDCILEIWQKVARYPYPPEACLVNFYQDSAKMGLHQDRDEQDFDAPVVSISLGDSATFRIGGTTRGGKTQSLKLSSGDVFIMEKETRLAFHGIDKIFPGTSTLLKSGGRINLTLRRVRKGS